ncbi:uncharacterized protein V1510DRAFT_417407 [Dipodascopsis tothii]|uniref:uncharacterized protein n=1 Tax=Dipodascopsis tothii TaxID=44089 RepID=UPI0034CD0275
MAAAAAAGLRAMDRNPFVTERFAAVHSMTVRTYGRRRERARERADAGGTSRSGGGRTAGGPLVSTRALQASAKELSPPVSRGRSTSPSPDILRPRTSLPNSARESENELQQHAQAHITSAGPAAAVGQPAAGRRATNRQTAGQTSRQTRAAAASPSNGAGAASSEEDDAAGRGRAGSRSKRSDRHLQSKTRHSSSEAVRSHGLDARGSNAGLSPSQDDRGRTLGRGSSPDQVPSPTASPSVQRLPATRATRSTRASRAAQTVSPAQPAGVTVKRRRGVATAAAVPSVDLADLAGTPPRSTSTPKRKLPQSPHEPIVSKDVPPSHDVRLAVQDRLTPAHNRLHALAVPDFSPATALADLTLSPAQRARVRTRTLSADPELRTDGVSPVKRGHERAWGRSGRPPVAPADNPDRHAAGHTEQSRLSDRSGLSDLSDLSDLPDLQEVAHPDPVADRVQPQDRSVQSSDVSADSPALWPSHAFTDSPTDLVDPQQDPHVGSHAGPEEPSDPADLDVVSRLNVYVDVGELPGKSTRQKVRGLKDSTTADERARNRPTPRIGRGAAKTTGKGTSMAVGRVTKAARTALTPATGSKAGTKTRKGTSVSTRASSRRQQPAYDGDDIDELAM